MNYQAVQTRGRQSNHQKQVLGLDLDSRLNPGREVARNELDDSSNSDQSASMMGYELVVLRTSEAQNCPEAHGRVEVEYVLVVLLHGSQRDLWVVPAVVEVFDHFLRQVNPHQLQERASCDMNNEKPTKRLLSAGPRDNGMPVDFGGSEDYLRVPLHKLGHVLQRPPVALEDAHH